MSYGGAIARLFRLDDAGWRRHANPWSAWSRALTAPVLFAALWSAHGIGWWSVAPITAVALWLWINPRLFPPPARYDAWISRAVLGEQLWTTTPRDALPAQHRRGPHVLNAVSALAAAVFVAALVVGDLRVALAGYGAAILLKFWFLDRMVLLHGAMRG